MGLEGMRQPNREFDLPPTDVVEQFPDADNLVSFTPEEEMDFYYKGISENMSHDPTQEGRQEYMKELVARIQPFFEHRNPEAWTVFIQELDNLDSEDTDVAKKIAQSALRLRSLTYDSLAAYEHEQRRSINEDNHRAPLTADLGIAYDLKESDAYVHFTPSRTIKRRREQMEKGMKKLAFLLDTQDVLANVQNIIAESWIVKQHPKLFTRNGFTLVEDEEKAEPDTAIISRNDFISRFGERAQ